MLIIIDKKIPEQAKDKLKEFGELMELETTGITYDAISGHPDIFFHQIAGKLVLAPNLPEKHKEATKSQGIDYVSGEQDVGSKYPASSAYCAVSTPKLLIHNFRNTDAVITTLGEDADLIHVDQGYTRCNLLALDDDHFISSDDKIKRVFDRFDKECLYVDPRNIVLEGFSHGFFGGCAGIHDKKIFIIGSLANCPDLEAIMAFVKAMNYEIVELYNGPLIDGGSILFLNDH